MMNDPIEMPQPQPTYWMQIFYLLLTVFCSYFLLTIISVLFIKILYHVSFLDVMAAISSIENNPQAVMPVKIIQVFAQIGIFIIPPFLFLAYKKVAAIDYLTISKRPDFKRMVLGILLIILSSPLILLINEWNQKMVFPEFLKNIETWMRNQEDQLDKLTKIFLQMNSFADLIFNLFMFGALAAIGEELLFRGIGQKLLTEWIKNIHWGIWISATIFSAIHLQFYGFFPRMLLGVLLGYMFYWSGNLWVPIVAHFFNNASQVVMVYLFQRGLINLDIDKMETFPVYITLIFSVLLSGAVFLFYRSRTE